MLVWIRASLLTLLLALVADPAGADLRLAVSDCGGTSSAVWFCGADGGDAFVLVGSVRGLPSTPLTGAVSVVDFGFQTDVPGWWLIGDGLCRTAGRLRVDHRSLLGGATCAGYFEAFGEHASTAFSYRVGPVEDPNDDVGAFSSSHARLVVTTSLDSTAAAMAGAPGTEDEVLLFTVAMTRSESSESGPCHGCTDLACVMLLRTTLHHSAGTDDTVLMGSDPAHVWLQDPVQPIRFPCHGATSAATRSTWGQVKSLYR